MIPGLVALYLLTIGLAAWGAGISYGLRQKFGRPFLKTYHVFILLSFAYALVNFIGEIFVPEVFPGPSEALVKAYMVVDLITIPLLGLLFYFLFSWIMRLLDRRTPPPAKAVFGGIEACFLTVFVISFTSYFVSGISSLTTAAVVILNGIVLVLLVASVLILAFLPPAEADRRRLARGMGLVNGVSLAVLVAAIAVSRAAIVTSPAIGRILPAGLTFLINLPGLFLLRRTIATVPSLLTPAPSAEIAPAATFELLGLTDREKEIVRFIAQGLNNREIGKRLFIAPQTVKNHITNIYAKTGARNRVQLTNLCRGRAAGPETRS